MTQTHDPEPHPYAPPATRRRVPPWVLAVAGVVLLAVVGGGIALLTTNRAEPPVAPDDVVVTLPAPSPTVQPVERPTGSPFADGLPQTVLQFALAEQGPHTPLVVQGAVEAHRLVYTDGGGTDLVALAGQWRDVAAATAAFDARRAEVEAAAAAAAEAAPDPATATPDATEGSADDGAPVAPQDGVVTVDGAEVGTYVIVPLPDGSGTALWRNGTVVVEVVGPAAALPSFFAAFPL